MPTLLVAEGVDAKLREGVVPKGYELPVGPCRMASSPSQRRNNKQHAWALDIECGRASWKL